MIRVSRSTHLPAEVLWSVVSDVRGWASWLPTVDAVRVVEPERPDGVGSSYVLDQPGLPRATWTVTEWRPGLGFTWESRSPGVTSTGRHELVPGPDGTTIELGLDWAGPFAGLVRRTLGRRTEGYVTREAEALEETAAALRTGA